MTTKAAVRKLFSDKEGRIVIWQWPNVPLAVWIVLKLLASVISAGQLRTGSAHLATAFIFLWAYLELTAGVSYFRRLLGLAVLVATVRSLLVQ